ncbi:hypothetical protein LCGC14_1630270 [marine sediment metagenome]|uniref:Uncharacterized protein n=1 Tax=marine sediment metagenome TaxID=412755 RepID=A0A0F9KIF7_9ZZZZ
MEKITESLNQFQKNSFNNPEQTHLRKLSCNEKEVDIVLDEELKEILTITIEPRFHKLYQKCE